MAVAAQEIAPALCVDLDGTLIRSDLLLESLLLLIRRNPLYLFCIPLWLLRGRAALKAEVAARVTLAPALLPYHRPLLEWLQAEREQGRALWLCSASNHKLAEAVAAHLGIFEGVLASDTRKNLAGSQKAAALVARFGRGGFDYCGNETRDLIVWREARGAIVVADASFIERVRASVAVLRSFAAPSGRVRPLVRALRPHQWAKNVLVFVPLLAAHQLFNLRALAAGLLAFMVFSLCASSVYVLNDLLDLEADRAHVRKVKRPFAAGDLPISIGLALIPALLGAALLGALWLPARFQLALGAYFLLTVAYSLRLKRILVVDAVALAGLYTVRIIGGAGAAGVPVSFWLLLFSVFLFLSLAFVKRYAELESLRRQQRLSAAGRRYHVQDLSLLQSFGTAAGYLSVLVLALYINSPEIAALYHHPKAIWMLCVLLLYWVSRVWMTAYRGGMHDDPVVYALRDKVSLGIGVLAAVALWLAV